MQTHELIRLIETVKANQGEPKGWHYLSAALESRGQTDEADFCRWRASACGQNAQDENKTLLAASIQQLIRHTARQAKEPLVPFPHVQRAITALLHCLLSTNDDGESVITSKLLVLFTTLEPIRLNALDILARQSWNAIGPHVAKAQSEPESQSKIAIIADLWADLFRECPREMSHAYLSAGMAVRPTDNQHRVWNKLGTAVSTALGRNVGDIVNEQIPDLP